jgi:hypothetical protein
MIRTLGDLYREYARVVDMCDGTLVSPNECVRYPGHILGGAGGTPCLRLKPIEHYTFAVGIVEGRPVFHGDTLWHTVLGTTCVVGAGETIPTEHAACFSWDAPKRARTIDLPALPVPLTVSGDRKLRVVIVQLRSEDDGTAWLNAFIERIES